MNRFGVSTHLFHQSRLAREHLVDIAGHGFEAVELVASRAHFDYSDPSAVQSLGEWLSDTRLELHSVHAPADDDARGALAIAGTLPFPYLIVHPGRARDIESLAETARAAGIKVAIELRPGGGMTPESLVHLLEEELEDVDVGACLDYGHANLLGDVTDAVETISGHMLTTHLHDNAGKRDDHLVPFAGAIDWAGAIMATQKVGYDGVLMFEMSGAGSPADALKRAVMARERLEKLFIVF